MKMAKASEKDIDAAGDAMSVLHDIGSGYYPKRDGDDCEDTFFDEDDRNHLRRFYDLMADTLDKAPGWPGRVIGGMCYVIMFGRNKIVDPDADVLELHPRFAQVQAQRDELLAALRMVMACAGDISAAPDGLLEMALDDGDEETRRQANAFLVARAAIAKVKGGAT